LKLVSRAVSVSLCLALCFAVLLGTQARAEVFREDFNDNSIDPTLWTVEVWGSGPQLAEANQQLEIFFPGSSSGADFGCKLASTFLLRGDFDVQVDFLLITWPFGNGVRMGFGIEEGGVPYHAGVERTSFGQDDYPWEPREVYCVDFPDGVHGITGTSDMIGSLRLVRYGATQTGYYYGSGEWVVIGTGPAPTEDVAIKVAAWSAYQFMHWDVLAAWDNLVVNSGELVWPQGPMGACCFPSGDCLQGTADDCEGAGGSYMGDETPCDPNPCEPTLVQSTTWGRIKVGYR
jgi:hypothetical protein